MATERMYELAFRYKKTKLWQRMFDSEIFAVELSDGEIGYCSIMGRMGEVNAVAVYVGAKGFQSLRTIMTSIEGEGILLDYNELLLSQDCTQCGFDNKDALLPYELDEVRAYAKAHGIKLGGANAFPQFVRYKPYRHPWEITSELDRRRICEALEAGIFLSELLSATSKENIGLVMVNDETETIPLLIKGTQGFVLKTTPVPPGIPVVYASPKLSNDLTAARLKKLKKKGTLQCAVTRLMEPIQENEDEAPYYAVVLVAVDEKTEMILPPTPATFFEEHPEKLLDTFAEMLLENEIRPNKIKAGDERTFALLENFCKTTDIKLVRAKEDDLAPLRNAKDSLLYGMLSEDEDPDEDEVNGIGPEQVFDMIMMLGDNELKQMPKSMVKQLLALSDDGVMPPEVEVRLRKLFKL